MSTRLFFMIRKIIKRFKYKKILKSFSYGDVIWCKVDKYGDQFSFEENHQVRPFLFVKYEHGHIYGYTLTHTSQGRDTLACPLRSHDGDCVLLMCLFELKTLAYAGYSERMEENDLSKVSKIIYNMHEDADLRHSILKTIKIEENDIVEYKGDKYLVYANELKRLTLYKLQDSIGQIKINHKNSTYYIENKPLIVSIDEVVFYDKFNDDIKTLFKNARKDSKAQIKGTKGLLNAGDIYKTGTGRYLVLEADGDKILVTKYGNPDYIVRNSTAKGKQKVGSITDSRLKEFKEKLKKMSEIFS